MKYCVSVFYFFSLGLLIGCSTPFMGAKMTNIVGFMYLERWYLNPEYDKGDIPTGTAFYGDAAEKLKDKFIVKYYIYDGKKSDVEISRRDMWVINHNGKRSFDQDDDNLFYYEKLDNGDYEKYVAIPSKILAAIRFCDNGWCQLYPSDDPVDLYVKQIILKEPLQPEPRN